MVSGIEEEVDVRQVFVGHILELWLFKDVVYLSVSLVIKPGDLFRDFWALEVFSFEEKLFVLAFLLLNEVLPHGIPVRMQLDVVAGIGRTVEVLIYCTVLLSSFIRDVDQPISRSFIESSLAVSEHLFLTELSHSNVVELSPHILIMILD